MPKALVFIGINSTCVHKNMVNEEYYDGIYASFPWIESSFTKQIGNFTTSKPYDKIELCSNKLSIIGDKMLINKEKYLKVNRKYNISIAFFSFTSICFIMLFFRKFNSFPQNASIVGFLLSMSTLFGMCIDKSTWRQKHKC